MQVSGIIKDGNIPKSTLKIILFAVAALVWGHNAYKFFAGLEASDEPAALNASIDGPAIVTYAPPSVAHAGRRYAADFRDPFQSWLGRKTGPDLKPRARTGKQSSPAKKQGSTPAMRLTGVITDVGGTLAILEVASVGIFFARPGDMVAGIKVMTIDSAEATVKFKQQKITLRLQ